ncbi:MAG TPA: Ig-like domain-containing protein, partial [Propionicimonas sp.]|nr:Ig-like domain-containing protein [Propionicimonas sp.]
PAPNAADVNRYVAPRVTFDEAVQNVTASTLILRNTATGALVPTSVTYDSASRSATLVVNEVLDPLTTYRLAVRGGVQDLAGNGVATSSWTFTTGEHATYEIGGSARVEFLAGTYTGYQFSSKGGVQATRTYTLPRPSGANASLAGTLPGQTGTWFYVTNGVWSGYWIRQSPGAYLSGTDAPAAPEGNASYSPAARLVFKQGTHTGYRFDSYGRPTALRTYSLGADSGANTSALRAISNQYGRWFYVTNGVWSGYWIQASDEVYLRDPVENTAAEWPARVEFQTGTYTGYKFSSTGAVTGSRTYTLSRDSGADASESRTLPGQSGTWLRISNGVWGGYWVRVSPGAHIAGEAGPSSPASNATYSPAVRLVFKQGTHTGYRLDADGRPTSERTYTLGWDSGASASALRAMSNQYGRWFQVTNGVWGGYWVQASDVVFLAP